jgi:serine/threonine protein kinase
MRLGSHGMLAMSAERTLPQSGDDLRRAQERSLQRSRPPTQVPGYEMEHFLGAGAYGEVWVAVDRNTGRRVAIKFYAHRGGLDWSLLSREVEKLAFLFADRYVVQLIDVGWEADPPYYVMEYIEQGSLEDRLRQGPLSVSQAVQVFRDVAVGLVHAHGKGVLHCDLKPANVLLDQDFKPRLADFGQSRLSHEQTPALGTLFYMAPEQADLAAVPDARWDVYALGALLYCMLTGNPPYRTEGFVKQIEQAESLSERLAIYRRGIERSPRPAAHRQAPGVDRALVEIIDRCLAVQPNKRFANVQAVLSALEARSLQRARRPLLVFGVLGPLLLLAITGLYAWNAYNTVMRDSDEQLTDRALESNRFAARFVAEAVARQIDRRWLALEREAADPEFARLLLRATDQEVKSAARQELQQWMEAIDRRHSSLEVASWFVSDDIGRRLARYPFSDETKDGDFAFRDYFHGQGKNLPPSTAGIEPIEHVHRSIVFESKTTGKPVVAFSAPVWYGVEEPERRVVGVLTMTVELGNFAELHGGSGAAGDQFAVLIDTRQDENGRKGSILEHPYLPVLLRRRQQQPDFELPFLDEAHLELFRKIAEELTSNESAEDEPVAEEAEEEPVAEDEPADDESGDQSKEVDGSDQLLVDYRDPIGEVNGDYAGRWLAAAEPVIVSGRPVEVKNTDWVVLVQERHATATEPVSELAGRLVRKGIWALSLLVGVIVLLWGIVITMLTESSRRPWIAALRRKVGLSATGLNGSSTSKTPTQA